MSRFKRKYNKNGREISPEEWIALNKDMFGEEASGWVPEAETDIDSDETEELDFDIGKD